jgi:hypothetical protein
MILISEDCTDRQIIENVSNLIYCQFTFHEKYSYSFLPFKINKRKVISQADDALKKKVTELVKFFNKLSEVTLKSLPDTSLNDMQELFELFQKSDFEKLHSKQIEFMLINRKRKATEVNKNKLQSPIQYQ